MPGCLDIPVLATGLQAWRPHARRFSQVRQTKELETFFGPAATEDLDAGERTVYCNWAAGKL